MEIGIRSEDRFCVVIITFVRTDLSFYRLFDDLPACLNKPHFSSRGLCLCSLKKLRAYELSSYKTILSLSLHLALHLLWLPLLLMSFFPLSE